MDEPTTGMAPKERIALMQLTADIVRARRISVLFTEHDMDVVFTNANLVMAPSRGKKIAEGTPGEVRDNPSVQAIYFGSGAVYDQAKVGVAT